MDEFDRGVLMAVSVLIACHDQPTMGADVLKELGLEKADCSGLSEYDKKNLRTVQGGLHGLIKLRGLNTGAQGAKT